MSEDSTNNSKIDQEPDSEFLDDIIGARLTIKQTQTKNNALNSLNEALKKFTEEKKLKIKVKLFTMLERLSNYGELKMPRQFNIEAKLNNGKRCYAIKPHNNIRVYGWHSKKLAGVFFISHYKYKKSKKLDARDTAKVNEAVRRIRDE